MTSAIILSEEFKVTEIGSLPRDWGVVKLGDVLREVNIRVGGVFKVPVLSMTRHEGLVLQQQKFDKRVASRDISKYKVVHRGDIVYGFPMDEGVIYKLRNFDEGAVSPVYEVWRLISEIIDSDYLDQTLRSPLLISTYEKLTSSVVERRRIVSKRDFQEIKIPLPPLAEQKKIAYVLSTVQTAIEKAEAVIKATKELKKSLIKHLFTYGPVSIDEAENVLLKETEIGMVPDGWEVVRLGEVVTFSSKPRNLNLSASDNVPFVPMEYIPDDLIDIHRYEMKKLGEIGSGTFFFKGDLLVAKITPSFENGKQCIANNLPSNFGYATTEVWPLHQTTRADLLYLFYHLKRKEVRTDIAGKMEGSTGRQRVPRHVLQSLYISLPSLSIQRQITDMLSPIDGKIEAEESKRKSLEALFGTLLSNLMTGTIRVNNLEVPV